MGKPEKALLISREPTLKMSIPVHFNPKEISIEKQVKWTPKPGGESDEPPEQFDKPQAATLSVTLHFDTYEQKTSVRDKTDQLMKLARMVSSSIKRPPLCVFSWGEIQFQGVVSSLSVKYTMFLSTGMPVRAECSLKMIQASQSVMQSGTGGGGGE